MRATMPQRTVTVGSPVGLHARPAGLISAAVFDSGRLVMLALPDQPDVEPVDASSALVLMTLGAEHGERVLVTCDDETVLDQIATMVSQDLTALSAPRHLDRDVGSVA